jgi:hypothetical protein
MVVFLLAAGAVGGSLRAQGTHFGGPSILSRGTRPIGFGDGEPVRFRAFASLRAGYYGALSPLATDVQGTPVSNNSFFSQLGFGAYGSRQGPRDSAWGSYSGNYVLFNERSRSGVNQSASIGYSRQVNRRWVAWVGANGMTQVSVLGNAAPIAGSNLIENTLDPSLEVVDGRVIGVMGQAGASYQATARLTFSLSGGATTQRRQSSSLASADAYMATGEINYTLNRREGVGGVYSYSKYLYSGGFGGADSMTWMGLYRRQLDRNWSLALGAGLFRMEAIRVRSFAVDPQVAALTGVSREVGRFYDKSLGLASRAMLSGAFRRSNVNIGFSRGQNPGNGFALAGTQERFLANAGYTATDRLSLTAGVFWIRQEPLLAGVAGRAKYSGYGPTAGLSYRLFAFVHASVQAQLWKQVLQTPVDFSPARYFVSAGLTFSPGEVPVRVF